MTVHDEHPDSTDRTILYDSCERCAEIACDPVAELDNTNLTRLWNLMIKVKIDEKGYFDSVADTMAARKLYSFAILLQKFGMDPHNALTPPPQPPVGRALREIANANN